MTEFGYVRIYQDSISVKSTSAEIQQANWNKIHNDLLEIATTYIQKYPPISASQYDKFGKYSADIIKKIDLTKLPQLAQK